MRLKTVYQASAYALTKKINRFNSQSVMMYQCIVESRRCQRETSTGPQFTAGGVGAEPRLTPDTECTEL